MTTKHLSDQIKKYGHYRSLDLTNKLYQVKALRLARKLAIDNPKILELGCADGSFASLVGKELGGEVWGVDITPENIRAATKRGVMARIANLENPLPYKSGMFDLVFALEVIEHVFDTDHFLSEVNRVLKSSGYLILSTPNLASLQNRWRLAFNRYPQYLSFHPSDGHIFLYTLPVVIAHLGKFGFKIIKATSPNFLNPLITKQWLPKVLRELSMRLGDLLPSLGSHLLVVARKSAG